MTTITLTSSPPSHAPSWRTWPRLPLRATVWHKYPRYTAGCVGGGGTKTVRYRYPRYTAGYVEGGGEGALKLCGVDI